MNVSGKTEFFSDNLIEECLQISYYNIECFDSETTEYMLRKRKKNVLKMNYFCEVCCL